MNDNTSDYEKEKRKTFSLFTTNSSPKTKTLPLKNSADGTNSGLNLSNNKLILDGSSDNVLRDTEKKGTDKRKSLFASLGMTAKHFKLTSSTSQKEVVESGRF